MFVWERFVFSVSTKVKTLSQDGAGVAVSKN